MQRRAGEAAQQRGPADDLVRGAEVGGRAGGGDAQGGAGGAEQRDGGVERRGGAREPGERRRPVEQDEDGAGRVEGECCREEEVEGGGDAEDWGLRLGTG